MKGVVQVSVEFRLLLFLSLLGTVAIARTPNPRTPSNINITYQYETPAPFYPKPKDWLPQDYFYQQLFSDLDPQIEREYKDRWRYHESQIRYSSTYWRHEHLTMASTDNYGRAPGESAVREEFATRIFKMRVDLGFRNYVKTLKTPTVVLATQQALAAVDQVKNVPIRFSSDPEDKVGELRFGWDMISDFSKLEYVGGYVEFGFYHSNFTGALTGTTSRWNRTSLSVNTNFEGILPRAAVSLPMTGETIEASLSKSLSSSVSTSVSSIQPLKQWDSARYYYWQVAVSF